ncbi:hypothetical protein PLESTB_000596600 [Pleodorina starrii]|uniref:Uncharacterized protein n=1 Tax=Pleodorina starrii TaxID=330485 RepID=A0A9W6BII7_9CHLO|nr:hypothetical protein PLESTB_000596600 [Pleodorina starrii]
MSLSESDDDVEPGSSADSLLRRMGRRAPPAGVAAAFTYRGRKEATMDLGSLEAQLMEAGVTSPFNTWALEEALRQQASSAVDRRHHEIEAFERALHGALSELQRVRAAEEARLTARVAEATRRFQHQMEALQQQYLAEVEKLKRQTVAELNKQRALSEAAIAARTRALQAELRYDRPAGLLAAGAVTAAAPQLTLRARDSSPGPGPGFAAWSGTGAGTTTGKPSANATRMRSAASARAGGAAAAGPGPGGSGNSPAAAATPTHPTPNRVKLESGEGMW